MWGCSRDCGCGGDDGLIIVNSAGAYFVGM